jgi:hypothetical protein
VGAVDGVVCAACAGVVAALLVVLVVLDPDEPVRRR